MAGPTRQVVMISVGTGFAPARQSQLRRFIYVATNTPTGPMFVGANHNDVVCRRASAKGASDDDDIKQYGVSDVLSHAANQTPSGRPPAPDHSRQCKCKGEPQAGLWPTVWILGPTDHSRRGAEYRRSLWHSDGTGCVALARVLKNTSLQRPSLGATTSPSRGSARRPPQRRGDQGTRGATRLTAAVH